ncbi:MAG: tetratricopeptide repeat protein [Bacteroidota bacterium]
MKKQKNTAQADTAPSVSKPDLYLLVYDEQVLMQQVLPAVSKSRYQPHILFCGNAPNGAMWNEWHAKGKAMATNSADEHINSEAIYFVADPYNTSILEAAITYYYSSKDTWLPSHTHLSKAGKSSGKSDLSWGTKIKFVAYNLLAQLLMPTSQRQHTYAFTFFGGEAVKAAITSHTRTAQQLLARCAYLDIPTENHTLTARELKYTTHNWWALWGEAFKIRLNWLVLDALKDKSTQGIWRMAFAVLFIIGLLGMPLISQQFGLTWDEPRHNEYSKLSLNYFTSMGEDTTCLQPNIPTQEFRYYGEHFNVIAAFLYTYILPLGEYETRHLLNAIYGLLAFLFAALIAKEIAGWRAGAIALLLGLLSPVFLAHSMNNPTDIPFAAGFAMAVYYLFKLYKFLPAPKASHILMAAVGIGMAVGSRVGGILLYAYAALFMGIHWLMLAKQQGTSVAFKQVLRYAKVFIVLVAIGHLLSISLWPFGQQHILTSWYEAFKKSTEGAYFTYNHELFEGARMYMANVPWYYLPKFILINTPLAVLAGVLLFVLLAVVAYKKFRQPVLIFFVLFAIVFPIVYAEFKSLYYYNGWRHYLFIYPFILAGAALGWEMITRLTHHTVAWVAVALSALPLGWMVNNTPNQTVYFNELIGGTAGAYGQYELDYYSNSCREAGEWLAQQTGNQQALVAINNKPEAAAYYAQKINPNLQFQWVREYEEQRPMWDYMIITTRTFSSNELKNGAFPPAGTIHTINVQGVPICAVVKRQNNFMPLGYQYFDKRQFDSSAYYFEQATAAQPMDEEAWRMLGNAYTNQMKTDSAERCLRKAIEIYPENYKAYNDLGLLYVNVKRDNNTGLDLFKKALEYKFNYTDAYYYAGATLLGQNDFIGCIPYFENGIKRGGNGIAEMHYNLGYAYLNTNNNKKAEQNFIDALNINDKMLMAYKALAETYNRMGRQDAAQSVMQRYYQLGGQ